MRVKELSLHGFKSFAGKHRFVFPEGITAIVGPNGSGKSNIADAVRWVLGEQRATALRAKRTDEIIFGGTERRARSGLAEVGLTLDNEDRWLDVEFSEVQLARRAHRDGVNTYFLNGSQVRLRDVADLLGEHLGHGGYSVIGQGMVDHALSLRPDERRILIDEAAGLVPLQRRRDRALGRLAETSENLTRVSDILDELAPRVRRMSRLAERAAHHDELADRLRALLLMWYGHHWYQAEAQRDRERELVASLRADSAGAAAVRTEQQASLEAAESALVAARGDRDLARRDRERLAEAASVARQEAAVARARLEGLAEREAERQTAQGAQAQAEQAAAERLGALDAELAARESELQEREEAAEEARRQLAAQEERGDALAQALDRARATALGLRSAVAATEERLAALEAERSARAAERHATEQAHATAAAQSQELATEAAGARQAAAAADTARQQAASRVQELEALVVVLDRDLAGARQTYAQADARLGALAARNQALDALFGEGEPRDAAVRIAAVPGARVVGTVAQLLDVTPGWEDAVAAALGSRVHGVVLRGQGAVAGALSVVAADACGRLTLVPLDDGGAGGHRSWTAAPGVLRGQAVVAAPEADGLVEALLGGTAFVVDLDAARAALAQADGPARSATRDGLLVLPHGVVVAGSSAGQALAIEAERRSLPEAVAEAKSHAERLAADADRLELERSGLETRLGELVDSRQELDRAHTEAALRADQAGAKAERAAREEEWQAQALERLDNAIGTLDEARVQLAAELKTLCTRRTEAEGELERAQQAASVTGAAQARTRAMEAGSAASQAAQVVAGLSAMRQAAADDLEATRKRMRQDQARAAARAAERAGLAAEVDRSTGAASDIGSRIDAADTALQATEAAVTAAEHACAHAQAALDQAARQWAAIENQLAEARVAEAHASERLARLGEQLAADLEIVAPEPGEEVPDTDHVEELAARVLAPVEELPADLERCVADLRRDLRTVGAIDREALATFRESSQRYEHLQREQADLESAQADVLTALEQLETEMAGRFDATFAAVAEAFARFFPQLFGGGEAELVLDRSEGFVGIDIVARPPGKRRQPLGLLSGGERSLTAVALVFALLQVSRTPFVVLDEVDAALDEANVARFRAALESLAELTQVVIITHNRGTIQAAETVYGITMSEDGASQVVSLEVPHIQ
jgi:chromosome segregation protein